MFVFMVLFKDRLYSVVGGLMSGSPMRPHFGHCYKMLHLPLSGLVLIS